MQVPVQKDGTLALEDVKNAIRAKSLMSPRTRLIAVENTQLRANGAPLAPAYLHQVRALADEHGLKVHTDGARIFNAAVALKVDVKELAWDSDSVTFCLSKGLLVVGSREFVAEARRMRQVCGGALRQAGVIAAAGIVALETMVERLAEDHANARYFAECLANVPGIELDPESVKTNMVFFDLARNGIRARELDWALGAIRRAMYA